MTPEKHSETNNLQGQLEAYCASLADLSDDDLIARFNAEVRKRGYVSSRGLYLAALHMAFIARDFDYSAVGNVEALSFSREVKLQGKKILPVE